MKLNNNNPSAVSPANPKHQYQVCHFMVDEDGERHLVEFTNIHAENIASAIVASAGMYTGGIIRTYPFASLEHPWGVNELAQYAAQTYSNWELSNNWAYANRLRRDRGNWEDLESIAKTAIWEKMVENPSITMDVLHSAGFRAISNSQRDFARNSQAAEYNPDWGKHNNQFLAGRATYPALDRLRRQAEIDALDHDLTDTQLEVYTRWKDERIPLAEIARELGKARLTVYGALYRAQLAILRQAIRLDCAIDTDGEPTAPAFASAGITIDDIGNTLAALKRKARK